MSIKYKVMAALSYCFMILINALANIIPFNGISTGQVADSYPNLFAPAGVTFSIWGLIYLLLGAFILFHLSQKKEAGVLNLDLIGQYFIISSIANGFWIIAWHFLNIYLSMFLMLVILASLIKISFEVNKSPLSIKERYLVRLPFSIYFGWINVATIANATVLFVSLGWVGFEEIGTVVILISGLIISGFTTLKLKNLPFGFVAVWAYIGILLKHTSANGFSGEYPAIIITVSLSILFMLAIQAYVLIAQLNGKERSIAG